MVVNNSTFQLNDGLGMSGWGNSGFFIDDTTYQSPDERSRQRAASTKVDMLVMHSTETKSLAETVACFTTEKERNVSVHYVVDRDGTIYQFVPENRAAYHAGQGSWKIVTPDEIKTVSDINERSIGIEFQRGPGETFTPEQIRAGLALSKDIIERNGIDPRNVVGHSDVAGDRKSDPGNDFPWELWVDNGLAVNKERRGNDGRSFEYSPEMQLAIQNGFFDMGAFKQQRIQQEAIAANEAAKNLKTEPTSEKTEKSEGLSTLLAAGISIFTGTNMKVAEKIVEKLAETVDETPTDKKGVLANNATPVNTDSALSNEPAALNNSGKNYV